MSGHSDETQVAIRDLAADLFSRRVDAARLEKVEATTDRFDTELWAALADAGLLAVVVPESDGGVGFGAVELALVLEQLGRNVAPVPLIATSVAAWCLATHGTDEQRARLLPGVLDGSTTLAIAPAPSTVSVAADANGLTGDVVGVP